MTALEQAIRDAVEKGGYKVPSCDCGGHTNDLGTWHSLRCVSTIANNPQEKTLLDPAFWQALGKARGWGELTVSRDDWTTQPKWLYEWKCLIDHLASGKDVESFFETV